jgi:hypothetical protein
VAAAARRAGGATRLFALAVDEHGDAAFSEVRHGTPVPLLRFHVDLSRPVPLPLPARPAAALHAAWQGDVEPVGYPFRFGLVGGPRQPVPFAFDYAGEWLLTATRHGTLHATRTDGSATEVLPRSLFAGQVLNDVHAVLGVAGGFAVAGRAGGQLVAAHYDFRSRTVRGHGLGEAANRPALSLGYQRSSHTLFISSVEAVQAVNLATGQYEARSGPGCLVWRPPEGDGPRVCWYSLRPEGSPAGTVPRLRFDPDRGELALFDMSPAWRRFVPLADGQPALQGQFLHDAVCSGQTLAAAFTADGPPVLHLFRGPEGTPAGTFPLPKLPWTNRAFELSPDGRLLALHTSPGRFEVRDLDAGGPPRCRTPLGRFHHDLVARLGESWLTLLAGPAVHLVRWEKGSLTVERVERANSDPCIAERGGNLAARPGIRTRPGRLPPFLAYDPHRFVGAAVCSATTLIAVVDRFGQVFLFAGTGALICAFFAFRHQLAAWMPDGTCLGPPDLLGRAPTPDAAEKIGQALRTAWQQGEGTIT